MIIRTISLKDVHTGHIFASNFWFGTNAWGWMIDSCIHHSDHDFEEDDLSCEEDEDGVEYILARGERFAEIVESFKEVPYEELKRDIFI